MDSNPSCWTLKPPHPVVSYVFLGKTFLLALIATAPSAAISLQASHLSKLVNMKPHQLQLPHLEALPPHPSNHQALLGKSPQQLLFARRRDARGSSSLGEVSTGKEQRKKTVLSK